MARFGMARLKVKEAPQHGVRTSSGGGKRYKKGKGVPATRSKAIKKKRTFLTNDEQALLISEYLELPKRKQGSDARPRVLVKFCKKYDVHIDYPSECLRKLKQTKQLPDRDGVGGAPDPSPHH